MRENIERIKERIAKLLAMAADSSSPEEAAIAAGRARKLMDAHQLEAWECNQEIQEDFHSRRASRTYATFPEYLLVLATAVAKFNDCQAVRPRDFMSYKMESKRNQNEGRAPKSTGTYLEFRGYATDVQMAVDMFERLQAAMNAQCKAYLAPFGYSKYPVKIGTAWKAYFCHAITSRLESMTKERDELTYSSSSMALVVVAKKKAVDEKFGEVEYGTSSYTANLQDPEVTLAAADGHRAGKLHTIINELEEGNGDGFDNQQPRLSQS